MNRLAKFVACAGVAAVTASAAAAQSIVMQKTLSLSLAKTIAEATLAECKSKGFTTSAVVVDRAGQVLVMLRDEGATGADRPKWRAGRRSPRECSARRRWSSRSERRTRRTRRSVT